MQLLGKNIYFRKSLIVSLYLDLDKILWSFTHNPNSLSYFYHFAIPKLVIQLKYLIVTDNLYFTPNKIVWYIKFQFKFRNQNFNWMQKQIMNMQWHRNVNDPTRIKNYFTSIISLSSKKLYFLKIIINLVEC